MRRYAAVCWLLLIGSAARAEPFAPEGFTLEPHVSGLNQPSAIAFTPDGRMLVAEKEGTIRVVEDGILQTEPFATIAVYSLSECGLLGLAVDPDFAANGYVYAFATVSSSEQRILRFTDRDGVAVDEHVLVDNLPTSGRNHNGGCLRVGPDGYLYYSIGDIGISEHAQDLATQAGKICRLRLDGSVPEDNPFTTVTGAPRAVYALGFRNPFRFCFAGDGRLYAMDVGSSDDARYEEINLVRPGGNYGWPLIEGMSADSVAGAIEVPRDYVDPLFAYHDEGAAIAGCVVYEGTAFPEPYRGNLFHLDYVSNGLFRTITTGSDIAEHSLFAEGSGGTVDLAVGPDGALYFTEMFHGEIKRLAYAQASQEVPDDTTVLSDSPTTSPICGQSAGAALGMVGLVTLCWRGATRRLISESPSRG